MGRAHECVREYAHDYGRSLDHVRGVQPRDCGNNLGHVRDVVQEQFHGGGNSLGHVRGDDEECHVREHSVRLVC